MIMKSLTRYLRHMRRRSRQRGVSLINVAIILVVSALLTSAALLYYSRYNTKTRVQNEIQTIADLKANMAAYGSRVGILDNNNASLAALVGQNFFPAQNVSGTGANISVKNQWGGEVTVTAVNTNAGNGLRFQYTTIPAADCTELAGSLDNIASSVEVSGNGVKGAGALTDLNAVVASCKQNGQDSAWVAFTLLR